MKGRPRERKAEGDFIDGPPPDELVIEDIVEGSGAVAAASDTVEVHYVGVDFSTGEQFDASWDRGESIVFPLSELIAGMAEIPSMKVGGRRQLIIPPELAYGPAGAGHRLSGATWFRRSIFWIAGISQVTRTERLSIWSSLFWPLICRCPRQVVQSSVAGYEPSGDDYC